MHIQKENIWRKHSQMWIFQSGLSPFRGTKRSQQQEGNEYWAAKKGEKVSLRHCHFFSLLFHGGGGGGETARERGGEEEGHQRDFSFFFCCSVSPWLCLSLVGGEGGSWIMRPEVVSLLFLSFSSSSSAGFSLSPSCRAGDSPNSLIYKRVWGGEWSYNSNDFCGKVIVV